MTSKQAANAARFHARQVQEDQERLAGLAPNAPLAERLRRSLRESRRLVQHFTEMANDLAREEEAGKRRREIRPR